MTVEAPKVFMTIGGASRPKPALVPAGMTSLRCEHCAIPHFLTVGESVQKETCAISKRSASFEAPAGLQRVDEAVVDASALTQLQGRDWWHFTTHSVWPGFDGVVHLGSLLSAMARVATNSGKLEQYESGRSAWWFHRVELSSTLLLDPTVYVEESDRLWEPRDDDRLVRTGHVVRYVNRQENPGSVSVAVHSRDVSVLDRVPLPLFDATLWELSRLRDADIAP